MGVNVFQDNQSMGLIIDIHLPDKAEKAIFLLHTKKVAEYHQYSFFLEKDDWKGGVAYFLPPHIEYRMQKFTPDTMVVFDADEWALNRGSPIREELLNSIAEKGCLVVVLHVDSAPSSFCISDRNRSLNWDCVENLMAPLMANPSKMSLI